MATMKRYFVLCLLWCLAAVSFGQTATPTDEEKAAGAATCFACGGLYIMLIVGGFVLTIALMVWVARDAKNRGMDSAILWMLLVFFTNFIGLIIYLFARPQGSVMRCSHCGNKRLAASAKCPHCGNA
jgi:hypothetical protein